MQILQQFSVTLSSVFIAVFACNCLYISSLKLQQISLITKFIDTYNSSNSRYYNNFNSGDKSFLLLNAEANYTIKRFSFTLSCDNLLNLKTYSYSNKSALTETRSVYNIRPRSILLKVRFRII